MDLFHVLAQAGGPPAEVLIDSSAVKAHRSASGGEGGRKIRPSADRAADAPPKSTRRPTRVVAPSPSCSRAATSRIARPAPNFSHGFRHVKSCTATRYTTATRSGGKSRKTARRRTSRPRPTANGRTALRRSSIVIATPSSACSAG